MAKLPLDPNSDRLFGLENGCFRDHERMRYLTNLFLVVPFCLACACTGAGNKPKTIVSAAQLYNNARSDILNRDYEQAIERLEQLEAQYPLDPHAPRGLMSLMYASFMKEDYVLTRSISDRFLSLYPKHPHADYAMYLRALSYYNEDILMFDQWFRQTRGYRDIEPSEHAFFEFRSLIHRFPSSRYASDAHQRMIHLRNSMARHHLNVAKHYAQRGAYAASARRLYRVLTDFDETHVLPEALSALVRTYEKMGLLDLAQDTFRILDLNYPQAPMTRALAKRGYGALATHRIS